MFRVHLKPTPPMNYREACATPAETGRVARLLDHMLEQGMILFDSCSATLSTVMTDAEIDALLAAFESGFERLLAEG